MRTRADSGFTTIRTEGGLVPPELLARVAAGDADLEGIDPAAYHLAAGERRNEAINRSWTRLLGAWASFQGELAKLPADDPATSVTRQRWSLVLFQELGYGQLQTAKAVELAHKTFPISHAWHAVPIHLVGAHVDLDRRTEGLAGAARTSPHGLVQELLNASDERLWGFVSNGLRLRLLRDNVSLTRQAYVEFDLEGMLDGQVYADFVVLWLLCHQSRVEGDPPEKCILERWVADAAHRGTRALDQLRDGVESAINTLGAGFLRHPQNGDLRDRLRHGALSTQDYYRQLLRLVYRLLFLFVAEDRDALLRPDADVTTRQRYQDFYSTARLRRLAARRMGGAHGDAWASLRLVCSALGRDDGEPALGLPGLGSFLWSDRAMPDLDHAQLANDALLGALRALTTVRDGKVTRSVDYRNLGSEELGGIYESLLELHPELNADTGAFTLRVAAGNERKTTGSYYTPTSLINELLDSALEPVLAEAAAAANPEEAVLALTVLDPACGSGHFLIAAAHRIASRLAAVRTGDPEPSPDALREALRDVVGRCIHGIDVNEMAVELCKVSLWMEAIEPGKPLSFLEHRIVCGNALLGATPRLLADGVPDEAFKVLEGDDKEVVTALKKRNKLERKGQGMLSLGGGVGDLARPIADAVAEIDALPDDSVEELHEKERRWAELQRSADAERAKLAADAWCAVFVAPKVKGAPVITDGVVRQIADTPETVDPAVVDEVRRLADEYRFVHFHLAFPDVFPVPTGAPENEKTGWNGGFSVVFGNPPWERVKLQEKEYFASRAPEIASAPNAAARKRMIAALEHGDPLLYADYKSALRHAEGESLLLRDSGRFPLGGRGDVNTYAVFTEGFWDAVSLTGRLGVIVPLGIATDDTTKDLFGALTEQKALVSLLGFENEERIFNGVHNQFKFALLTACGGGRPQSEMTFGFFARAVADLREPGRTFELTSEDLQLLNPETRTCPVFRSREDARLNRSIYRGSRVRSLAASTDGHDNWSVEFSRMFDMANDSHLFRTSDDMASVGAEMVGNTYRVGEERYLPLYEGKMIHQFNHRFGTYDGQTQAQANKGVLPQISASELADPSRLPLAKYWLSASTITSTDSHFTGYRRMSRNVDERTGIFTVFPRAAAADTLALFQVSNAPWFTGVVNSFVFDYLLRQKHSGSTLGVFVLRQMPLPTRRAMAELSVDQSTSNAEFLEVRVCELAYTAWDLQGFARRLGVDTPPFRWDEERRAGLRAELDAACFHLYEVNRDGAEWIMETFPIVKRKDEAAHGEYRTKRLTLECFDAMATAVETGEPYQTVLDPPPADPSLCHPESTRPDWAK